MNVFAIRYRRRTPMGDPAYFLGAGTNRALIHEADLFLTKEYAMESLAKNEPPPGYYPGEVVELRQVWEVLRKIN